MDYQVKEADQSATIYLTGELDMSVGEQIGSLIRTVGERNQNISLDFRDVTFVDSAGIGSLFFTTKDLLALGKHVEIVNILEEILDILRVLGFTEALGVEIKALDR
ncbi:STAS domain-containing protein [Brevibacillus sp. SYSU BS000544]|uniref:STAS domain-containing protein n=1 Tax=Brevibacillus sp. SYSU BS000544 TaxID=3416443 RepID=UPI003CE47CE4